MALKLSNWEVVVYILHTLGGGLRLIPTEDIAKSCFEIVPDSFSWVKYPKYPDKEVVRKALFAARQGKNGALVRGRAGRGKGQSGRTNVGPATDGWSLTPEGVQWILNNKGRLVDILRIREPNTQRQENLRKLSRIYQHPLYKHFLEQPEGFVPSVGEMAELFRCRVDADQSTWDKRFDVVLGQANIAGDSNVLRFINCCRDFSKNQAKGI
ncbi:MAG: hypothetical protein V1682_06755 [Candidatus Omnitrophota bacterium]